MNEDMFSVIVCVVPIPFSLHERVYMHNTFTKYRKSCAKTGCKYREKFPNRPVPSVNIIKNLAKKFTQVK